MFLLVGLGGALAGALGWSVLTVLLFKMLEPAALRDGQFVITFIFTVPFGALLGGAVSLVFRQARKGKRVQAGWLAVGFGAIILVFAALVIWGSADSRGGGLNEFLRTSLSLWISPSWLAAVGLTVWGAWQLMRGRSVEDADKSPR